MALMEELLGIENALAGGSDEQYRRHLDDDAVVIIPGQALSKDQQGYEALMSSAYSRADGEWKLVLHQQTPIQDA